MRTRRGRAGPCAAAGKPPCRPGAGNGTTAVAWPTTSTRLPRQRPGTVLRPLPLFSLFCFFFHFLLVAALFSFASIMLLLWFLFARVIIWFMGDFGAKVTYELQYCHKYRFWSIDIIIDS